jgi:hypothetical protein
MFRICIQRREQDFEDYEIDKFFEELSREDFEPQNFERICCYYIPPGTQRSTDMWCLDNMDMHEYCKSLIFEYKAPKDSISAFFKSQSERPFLVRHYEESPWPTVRDIIKAWIDFNIPDGDLNKIRTWIDDIYQYYRNSYRRYPEEKVEKHDIM